MGDLKIPQGYKLTEVGVIPEDWDASTIGSVTTWMSGGTPSRKNDDFWRGSIPWISGSTLKTLEIFTSDQFLTEQAVETGSKMAPLNSTLLLVRGSALHNEIRAGIVVAPVCFNQDVKALVPDKTVDPKYLTIYLLAMNSELLKLVSSAGNSAGVLDTELVQNFKFFKPPKKEQTAIANALSDVDALISSLEKLINKKQAIKTASMQQLLTGKTRLPQFAKYPDGKIKGTKQSELGEVPEDWEVKCLGELNNIFTGNTPSTARSEYYGDEYMFVSPADLHGQKYIKNTAKMLSKKGFNVSRAYPENSILFTCIGSTIGKCAMASQLCTSNQQINAVLPSESIDTEFLYFQLVRTAHVIKQQAGEQAVPIVNKTQFGEHLILHPIDREEQTAIATILSDMDTEIQTLEQRLNKTRQIKQGMMQELLTGKTRLRVEAING